MEEQIYATTQLYFDLWESKDLDNLEKLFNPNIILRDWTNRWEGKSNVIDANKKIFENEIKLFVIRIDICFDTAYCQIEIIVNGETLHVMDVIEFDDDNYIKSITAYKG
jgi:hypothetical protein